MHGKITKAAIDNLAPGPRSAFLWDTEITGFGCKVTPAGRDVCVLHYRTEVRDSRKAPTSVTLGKHGDITAEAVRRPRHRGRWAGGLPSPPARYTLAVNRSIDPGPAATTTRTLAKLERLTAAFPTCRPLLRAAETRGVHVMIDGERSG